ncbi:MAG: penicillin acylase family protein [Myxococcota bacterium]
MLFLLFACAPDATPMGGPRADRLDGPAEIVRDAEGVSHIYAKTDDDVFFLQGYTTARDRLFQMDLLRRRAHGRRAEILGADYVESDIQSRALQFTAWGQAEARWLEDADPDLYLTFSAYAAGVNAFIEEGDLAPQFEALGYAPEPWTVADTTAIEKLLTAGLSLRADQDLILGLLRLLVSDELFADFYRYAPLDPTYTTPNFYAEGANSRRTASGRRKVDLPEADAAQILAAIRQAKRWGMGQGGSNAMTVSGAVSEEGHALLASDSHQGIEHPAVYYLIHLNTADQGGDLDVIGATFPGVPMVMFGHNRDISWGPTTNLYDAADVYLESVVGGEDVRFNGDEIPMEEITHTIAVRDGEDVIFTAYEVPHHGPLFPTDGLPLPLSVSVRWTGYRPESVGGAFYDLNTAKSFNDFEAALRTYHSGGMHWVYADVEGNIGYSSYTAVPQREVLDPDNPPIALLPGEGGYEWLPGDAAPYATVPVRQIPWATNPAQGWLVTANNDPSGQTDDNDPYNDPVYLSGLFDIGTRVYRPDAMFAQMAAGDGIGFEDLRAVQLDTLSRPGERLVPFLLTAAARRPDLLTPEMSEAITVLEAWDFRCEVDQVAPTIFHTWLALFTRDVLEDEAGGLLGDLLFEEMDYQFGLVTVKMLTHFLELTEENIDAIEQGDEPFPSLSGTNFFDDQRTPELETRDEVILTSLSRALSGLSQIYAPLSDDPTSVSEYLWGRYHTIVLEDLAMPSASSARLPQPGGSVTVSVGDFTWLEGGALPAQYTVTNAPSNRFLYEMVPGAIRGEMILPGGQSERPGDPHHNDMLEEYTQGRYRAMRFYADEVAAGELERRSFSAGFPAR